MNWRMSANKRCAYCGTYRFFLHHLSDAYVRNSTTWVREHLALLDEQIEHANSVREKCTPEIQRLERLMAIAMGR